MLYKENQAGLVYEEHVPAIIQFRFTAVYNVSLLNLPAKKISKDRIRKESIRLLIIKSNLLRSILRFIDLKIIVMENNTIQQEIMLMTTTTFSNRQLCEKDDTTGKQHSSKMEQLEEACWDGLLNELLPEIMKKTADGKRLFIWHIRSGSSFLQIELSELPGLVEKRHSIDTYFFLSTMNYN